MTQSPRWLPQKKEQLRNVAGLTPRLVASIVAQAANLGTAADNDRARKVEELKQLAALLKVKVQEVALSVRERFTDGIAGKAGRSLAKVFVRVVGSLEKVEQRLETRVKKSEKGLAKAERCLDGLAEVGLGKMRKRLKRARKTLKRIYS